MPGLQGFCHEMGLCVCVDKCACVDAWVGGRAGGRAGVVVCVCVSALRVSFEDWFERKLFSLSCFLCLCVPP